MIDDSPWPRGRSREIFWFVLALLVVIDLALAVGSGSLTTEQGLGTASVARLLKDVVVVGGLMYMWFRTDQRMFAMLAIAAGVVGLDQLTGFVADLGGQIADLLGIGTSEASINDFGSDTRAQLVGRVIVGSIIGGLVLWVLRSARPAHRRLGWVYVGLFGLLLAASVAVDALADRYDTNLDDIVEDVVFSVVTALTVASAYDMWRVSTRRLRNDADSPTRL